MTDDVYHREQAEMTKQTVKFNVTYLISPIMFAYPTINNKRRTNEIIELFPHLFVMIFLSFILSIVCIWINRFGIELDWISPVNCMHFLHFCFVFVLKRSCTQKKKKNTPLPLAGALTLWNHYVINISIATFYHLLRVLICRPYCFLPFHRTY